MYRGTTPAFSFKLNTDIDFEQIEELYITFRSQLNELSFSKQDCTINNEQKTISIRFTQEQTLEFSPGDVRVQIRIRVGKDRAYATPVKTINISQILKDGVI